MPTIADRTRSFRWLFAELLVIVIGILIAIQVDEWRQYLQDREDEREVLASIQRDLDDILAQYVDLRDHFNISMDAATTLIVGMEDGELDEAAIVRARGDIGLTYLLSDAPTSFEGYLQSGAIGLIQDEAMVRELRMFFGYKRGYIFDLNEVHIRRSRSTFDVLNVDFRSVPAEDYASSGSSQTRLVVPVADFPTSESLQSELIQLNGFKRSILENLDEVMTFGRSLSSGIEERLSVH